MQCNCCMVTTIIKSSGSVRFCYIQSVTKLFGQNSYLDFIPPLPPNTMLITAIIIFSSSTVTSTVNVISPKATLLRGEGRGAVQN